MDLPYTATLTVRGVLRSLEQSVDRTVTATRIQDAFMEQLFRTYGADRIECEVAWDDQPAPQAEPVADTGQQVNALALARSAAGRISGTLPTGIIQAARAQAYAAIALAEAATRIADSLAELAPLAALAGALRP